MAKTSVYGVWTNATHVTLTANMTEGGGARIQTACTHRICKG